MRPLPGRLGADVAMLARSAARLRGIKQSVEAKLPLDLLGVYVLMPASLRVGA